MYGCNIELARSVFAMLTVSLRNPMYFMSKHTLVNAATHQAVSPIFFHVCSYNCYSPPPVGKRRAAVTIEEVLNGVSGAAALLLVIVLVGRRVYRDVAEGLLLHLAATTLASCGGVCAPLSL